MSTKMIRRVARAVRAHLLLACIGAVTQPIASSAPAQGAADSLYPVRVLDRPTTLPRGASRVDFWGIGARQPGSPTAVTAILGAGVGVTSALEVGGQIVPVTLAPGDPKFTIPSVYATYSFNIGRVSVAPTLQGVFPLRTADPFFVDVGIPLYYTISTLGYVAVAPTFSQDTRENGAGTSLSLPVTFMRQVNEQLNWQLSSGIGLSRFDPRFGLARRRESIDFNDVTVPLSAELMYTVAHSSPRRPLVDLSVQIQWPQLYTRLPGQNGSHMNDWSVQLQTSWYAIP